MQLTAGTDPLHQRRDPTVTTPGSGTRLEVWRSQPRLRRSTAQPLLKTRSSQCTKQQPNKQYNSSWLLQVETDTSHTRLTILPIFLVTHSPGAAPRGALTDVAKPNHLSHSDTIMTHYLFPLPGSNFKTSAGNFVSLRLTMFSIPDKDINLQTGKNSIYHSNMNDLSAEISLINSRHPSDSVSPRFQKEKLIGVPPVVIGFKLFRIA